MSDRTDRSRLLTINAGSSSLKFALYDAHDLSSRVAKGKVERIGRPDARMDAVATGGPAGDLGVTAPDHRAAGQIVLDWIAGHLGPGPGALAAVGHRVVHGGGRFRRPERVTPDLIQQLRTISPLDPDHLPAEIALMEAIGAAAPGTPQVACFDTAFHADMPRVARIVPIPRRYEAMGVRRHGFHGLSYAFLLEELGRVAGESAAKGRVILAHLGNGASLAAVRAGRGVDTTMGFTPASGLVMGTRGGDLDPGLGPFLARAEGMSPERFDRLINRESGLLGVSETSSDMRDLMAIEAEDIRAAEAVALFCYRVKTAIGAFAAALGGLDTLVFSGGIGENSPEVRRRSCEGLEFLGIDLDADRNATNEPVLSADDSRVVVRMIRTDEERRIAEETARLLGFRS